MIIKTQIAKRLIRCLFSITLFVSLLDLAGCGEPTEPQVLADFNTSKLIVKEGDEVLFTDQSTGGPASWEWTFPGANPATSSEQNNQVTYSEIGEWDVTLKVTNSSSSDVLLREKLITVRGTGIYYEPFFDSFRRTDDVVYGIDAEQHLMNIFEPEGDTRTRRPVILLLGGGAFQGSNLSLLDPLTIELVKWGFVVAQVRYRSGPPTTPERNFIKGQQDSKAAVRYFRKEADTWKVNPDQIINGGNGTGAFLALFHAYVDEDELTPEQLQVPDELGGLEGEQGNAGFSSEVSGVISLAGGMYERIDFIKEGEAPVFAVHGVSDQEVPYDTAPGVFGSKPITERAEEQNILNYLYTFPTGDHDTPRERPSDYIDELATFLRQVIL